MALATGGGGKIQSRPPKAPRSGQSGAQSLYGFFPPLPCPVLEAGALDEGRNWETIFLIPVRLHVPREALGGTNWDF